MFRHYLDDRFFRVGDSGRYNVQGLMTSQELCDENKIRDMKNENDKTIGFDGTKRDSYLKPFTRDINDWRSMTPVLVSELGLEDGVQSYYLPKPAKETDTGDNGPDSADTEQKSEKGGREQDVGDISPIGEVSGANTSIEASREDALPLIHESQAKATDIQADTIGTVTVPNRSTDMSNIIGSKRRRNIYDDISPEEIDALWEEFERSSERCERRMKEKKKRELFDGKDYRAILAWIPGRRNGEEAIQRDGNGLPSGEYLFVPEYSALLDGEREEPTDTPIKALDEQLLAPAKVKRHLDDNQQSDSQTAASSSKRVKVDHGPVASTIAEASTSERSRITPSLGISEKSISSVSWPSLWRTRAAKEVNECRISKSVS
jgi:hypothetical protein